MINQIPLTAPTKSASNGGKTSKIDNVIHISTNNGSFCKELVIMMGAIQYITP
jgi:hypothetical protein